MVMSDFSVSKCYHIGICVKNLGWTVSFFRDVLGCKLLEQSPRDPENQAFVTGVKDIEVTIAYMDCHSQLIEFMEYGGTAELDHYRPRMVDGGHFHFCMMVDNVDAAVKACLAYDPEISTLSPSPLVVDSGPNKGNTVILVVLPDGMMIEFTNNR